MDVSRSTLLDTLLAASVEHGNGGAVNDALRTDIHIRSGSHLSVLADTESIHTLPVVRLGIVGDNHTVGNHHSRSIWM